jgi:hypothetical protein
MQLMLAPPRLKNMYIFYLGCVVLAELVRSDFGYQSNATRALIDVVGVGNRGAVAPPSAHGSVRLCMSNVINFMVVLVHEDVPAAQLRPKVLIGGTDDL